MERWFLIYCKKNQDERAEKNLMQQGFIVFRPVVNIVKKILKNKEVLKKESLFPRYIFIFVDPNERSLLPIASTFGVETMVKFGSCPAIVPEDLIEKIQDNINKNIPLLNSLKSKETLSSCNVVESIYSDSSSENRTLTLMNVINHELKSSSNKRKSTSSV